jgi:hypothetical protein
MLSAMTKIELITWKKKVKLYNQDLNLQIKGNPEDFQM